MQQAVVSAVREPRGWEVYAEFVGGEIESGGRCVEMRVTPLPDEAFVFDITDGPEQIFGDVFETMVAAKVAAERMGRRRCWRVIEGGYP